MTQAKQTKLDARAHKRALAKGWTAERSANEKTNKRLKFSQKPKTRRQITYSHCRSLILSSPRFIAVISSCC
jgi:hypothetical protein